MKKAVKYIVDVPGSSGNFGCGYDVLAAALKIHNHFEFTLDAGSSGLAVSISGFGKGEIAEDASNIIFRTALPVWKKKSFNYRKLGRVSIKAVNRIPIMKGLGSSATARVAGALFANEAAGLGMDNNELLAVIAGEEGHYDNAAASLLGGVVICNPDRGVARRVARQITKPLCIVVPDINVSTSKARKMLPAKYSMGDVVFNLSRAAAIIDGIYRGRFEPFMFEDRIHTPFRKKLIKGFDSVEKAALGAGALGVFISGSGSAVGAVAQNAREAAKIARAMKKAFAAVRVKAAVFVTGISPRGAVIRHVSRSAVGTQAGKQK
ncbi:MAG: homoserine kinase [Elusimicrobia bacterium CG_4_8_14_3_um_filter_50_9]|nr:MAG: homoserine kinase [Elusimicrobia bacterium CG_4_8_14_3_um_filter_50_9]